MGQGISGRLIGLDKVNAKLGLMKDGLNGAPLAKVALAGARLIASQAKRNARRGPSGLVVQNIIAIAGRKASKYGAVAVARAKWRGTGAILEEWGTVDERLPGNWAAMRIPLGKLGVYSGNMTKSGRYRKGSVMTSLGGFGFVFARKIRGMSGTRFFERAVESEGPQAVQGIIDGVDEIIADAASNDAKPTQSLRLSYIDSDGVVHELTAWR